MKAKILAMFAENPGVLSGTRISAALGVSRVAVWKHIQRLKSDGYPIIGTAKGYLLADSSDLLFPWAFGPMAPLVHYAPEISSTMDLARDLARAGCPHLTVVIAGRQTKGRGRLHRLWASESGGLYFTLVLRPRLAPQRAFRLTFLAGLTLALQLRQRFEIPAMVKWPNDILVHGRKLAGMLSEMETRAEMIEFVNIGIGINVNNVPPAGCESVALKALAGRACPRRELLKGFIEDFSARLSAGGDLEQVVADWKPYTATIGRKVTVATHHQTYAGLARDVDEGGALLLEQADGRIIRVDHGDCFHAPLEDQTIKTQKRLI